MPPTKFAQRLAAPFKVMVTSSIHSGTSHQTAPNNHPTAGIVAPQSSISFSVTGSIVTLIAVPQNSLWSAGCWQSCPTLNQALELGVGLFGRADMEPEPLAMVAHPLLFLPQVSGRYL